MNQRHLIGVLLLLAIILLLASTISAGGSAKKPEKPPTAPPKKKKVLTPLQRVKYYMTPTKKYAGCVSFNPYVKGYNEHTGPHPPKKVIDQQLDNLVKSTNFRCIQIYKLNNGLAYAIEGAKKRGLKVLQVIWLEPENNTKSIQQGIQLAKKYKNTIIGISCGSELGLRSGKDIGTREILNCVNMVKKAKVIQPVTTNELLTTLCNNANPCLPWTEVTSKIDYISYNTFPWWSNMWAGCVPATAAVDVHYGEYRYMKQNFPKKLVVITEWGWVGGPNGYKLTNRATGKQCTGVASEANQDLVVGQTLKLFVKHKIPSNFFSFNREPWKAQYEDTAAAYWGICDATAPYKCKNPKKLMDNAPEIKL